MTQLEDCEVIEIDAEQPQDGTLVHFHENAKKDGLKTILSFNEVITVLEIRN
jgi:hypothetical protein